MKKQKAQEAKDAAAAVKAARKRQMELDPSARTDAGQTPKEALAAAIARGHQRPDLWDSGKQKNLKNLAQLKATQKMVAMLKEVDPKNPERFLPEESKKLLEQAEITDALKKQYEKERK